MSRHRLCISLPFWCAVLFTITGKRLTSFSCSSLSSSPLDQSLVVFDVVFLVVGLLSIVSARLGFQDLVFGVLTSMLSFIARGRLHSLLISFSSPFPSLFSHLFAVFIASLVALPFTMFATRVFIASLVALPFTMFATRGLDNVFVHVCYVSLEGYSGLKFSL
ncbi:hypothetical protein DY000_02031224 [Brassica cretica]|uniref:Uncharacterized protein n=1 Tax=Brassica cretica TaxID=69181 RepID=A0ABQ7DLD4_BRACR|nr:hypothetical protein DY000_02031224 [Brassica cretica]